MDFKNFQNKIIKIKHLSLSGELSHSKLSPPHRLELAKKMREKSIKAKKASVLVLFYPDLNGETMLVLILRKSYKGVHSAQISFPGGKPEKTDQNLLFTALRETEEEIGVKSNMINIIRELTNIYIPPSNFDVHPFIGVSKKPLKFKKQEEEVENVIQIKLKQLLDKKNIIITSVETSYKINVDVPAFKFDNHIIWGATAMILSEFIDLFEKC